MTAAAQQSQQHQLFMIPTDAMKPGLSQQSQAGQIICSTVGQIPQRDQAITLLGGKVQATQASEELLITAVQIPHDQGAAGDMQIAEHTTLRKAMTFLS